MLGTALTMGQGSSLQGGDAGPATSGSRTDAANRAVISTGGNKGTVPGWAWAGIAVAVAVVAWRATAKK